MRDYLKANLDAYEQTAEEFQHKKAIRLAADRRIADDFAALFNEKAKVLELGTGSGQLAKLLSQHNLEVEAIEYAPKMAELAAKTAPKVRIIVDEFIEHDFKDVKYDGIIGIAFVHLFNEDDAKLVMQKLYGLLNPGGYLKLATTIHDRTYNDIVRKTNFKTAVTRFRRHYTVDDFKDLFKSNGLKVVSTTMDGDREVEDKLWVQVVGQK